MKRTISKALMAVGAVLVLGAAGDSDTGALTIEGAVLKVGIGIALFLTGYILHKNKSSKAEAKEHLFTTDLSTVGGMGPAYNKKFNTTKEICQL